MNAVGMPQCMLAALLGLITSHVVSAAEVNYGADIRYRYEIFGTAGTVLHPGDRTSRASTARLSTFFDLKTPSGVSGFAEIEAIGHIVEDDFNISTIRKQSRPGYPEIPDPEIIEINQAYLQFNTALASTAVRAGRQEITINDGRFISASDWRQNHQSVDAVSLTAEPMEKLDVEYGYINGVNTVFGRHASNGRVDMSSHYFNVGYEFTGIGILKSYGIFLDYDDRPERSTNTVGIRFEGNSHLFGEYGIHSFLEYASQVDAGDNPNNVDAEYLLLELGISFNDIIIRGGFNQLTGSSAAGKFSTPLARPFNGWTELFIRNPSLGDDHHDLEVLSVAIQGRVPGIPRLDFAVIYYDYSAISGDTHYGSELDLKLEYEVPVPGRPVSIGWRFGNYFADRLYSDTLRSSLYITCSF